LFEVCEGVELDAIKKCETDDCVVLRMHEYRGQRSNLIIRSPYQIKSFQETDLLENPISLEMPVQTLEGTVNPYEIRTFKVKFCHE
jgi:alpha-mannosidase